MMSENEIPDLNTPLDDEPITPSNSHVSMESEQEPNTPTTDSKPEWLMDKYLSGGRSVNDAIEIQAKSAMELNRKLSQRNPNEFFALCSKAPMLSGSLFMALSIFRVPFLTILSCFPGPFRKEACMVMTLP